MYSFNVICAALSSVPRELLISRLSAASQQLDNQSEFIESLLRGIPDKVESYNPDSLMALLEKKYYVSNINGILDVDVHPLESSVIVEKTTKRYFKNQTDADASWDGNFWTTSKGTADSEYILEKECFYTTPIKVPNTDLADNGVVFTYKG